MHQTLSRKWINALLLSCDLALGIAMVWPVPVQAQTPADTTPALHHLVLVSFSEDSTPQQRQQVIEDSLTLLRGIPGVEAVAAGHKAQANRPVHIQDYDVGIYVRLSSESALADYSAHPRHQQLLQRNKATIAGIRVIDFVGEPEPAVTGSGLGLDLGLDKGE
ncbi:MAG: Dabb family protein [Pseudomonadota bacterium]|nr:Dabb family protein [Pseudomonadota bacterium]